MNATKAKSFSRVNSVNKDLWTRYFQSFELQDNKKIEELDVSLVVEDCEGEIFFSDLQLQEGMTSTGHMLANQELLSREYVGDQMVVKRHFNAVIRGSKVIGVPNRALPAEEKHIEDRVTGGMDYSLLATSDLPNGGVTLAHFQYTRTFILQQPLRSGERLEFKATSRRVAVNDQETALFTGFYHTIPGLFGRFHVDLKTAKDQAAERTGSGYLLCEVDTWLKGEKW